MLRNELLLCRKILSENLPDIVRFHAYTIFADYLTKFPKRAYREIKVQKKGSKLKFNFISGPCVNENNLLNAYALHYRNCPSDKVSNRFYFGDIYIPIKDKCFKWDKENFLKFVKPPEPPKGTLPQVVSDFYNFFWENIDAFWEFISKEHQAILENPTIERFYKEEKKVKNPSKNYSGLYIHFDMTEIIGNTHWYTLDGVLEKLDNNEIGIIKDDTFMYHEEVQGYSLLKKLIHTIGSGDEKNDNQFPGFDMSQRYKTFWSEEKYLRDLFYYPKIIQACRILIPNSWPTFLRLIPSGNFSAMGGLNYFTLIKPVKQQRELDSEALENAEESIQIPDTDPDTMLDLFSDADGDVNTVLANVSEGCAEGITSFDLILVRNEQIDSNLGEINNLDRSTLRRVTRNIADIALKLRKELKIYDKFRLTVVGAFYDLHPDTKKFQSRCAQMMLKIYRDAYYGEPDLEQTFIDQVLFDVRKDGDFKKYLTHKYNYHFLKRLAKEKKMEVTREEKEKIFQNEQKSEMVGRFLARICWPLHFHLSSFTKVQVGNMRLKIRSTNPLKSVEDLLIEYSSRIRLHEDEAAGTKRVKLNVIAMTEINKLITEFKKPDTDLTFVKTSFLRGFIDEYQLELYHAQPAAKPKS
jgi:hypothetical protein